MCQTLLDSHTRLYRDDNEELFCTPARLTCGARVSERLAGSAGCPTCRVPAHCSSAGCSGVTASTRSGSKAKNLFQRYCCCSGSFDFLRGRISSHNNIPQNTSAAGTVHPTPSTAQRRLSHHTQLRGRDCPGPQQHECAGVHKDKLTCTRREQFPWENHYGR